MSPFGPVSLGPHPSPACSSSDWLRNGGHRNCSGSWRPFVIFASTTCTCSCHKPAPKVPPRGGSGGSDVTREVQETTDRRLRDLAEWYSGVTNQKPHVTTYPAGEGARGSTFVENPGMIASGGGWRIPPEQDYYADSRAEPVTPDEEHMPKANRTNHFRIAEPEIDPAAAKLMGWVDEAAQWERDGTLQGPEDMVDVSDPASYEIPEVPKGLDPSGRRLPSARECSWVIFGDGQLGDSYETADMLRNEVLVTGRAWGKRAAADVWREAQLEKLKDRHEGLVVTILSRAVYELAERSLAVREVEAARAMQAGKGLAVIRGETQLTDLHGVPLMDGDIIREDCIMKLRQEDTYLQVRGIPTGCIYDFPHREAFEAWQDRNA